MPGAVFQMLGADGRAVGAGFLAGQDTAFTCAHVVHAAGQEPGGRVEIAFPGLPGRPRAWGQVLTEGWREPEARDVAVLRLTGLPQRAGGLPVGVAAGCRGHRVYSFGFPAQAMDGGHFGYATAADLLGGPDEVGPLLQLAGANGLTSGFSGAPVVDEMTGLVVGMVTAVVAPDTHLKGLDIAYATPAEVLREVWPPLAERQVCPYRGLEAFGAQHAQWFHGRERAVEKVLAAFGGNRRLLMLLGPSGAGKSSLLNAGVLPALADGAVAGSDRWLTLVTRPGRDLLAQLEESGLPGAASGGGLVGAVEARLAAGPEHDRLLLVIDQFEELLTQPAPAPAPAPAPEAGAGAGAEAGAGDDGHGGDVRIRAVQELTALAASAVPVTLLLITRNDFYAPLSELAPDLIDAASPGMCNIPATLGRPELEAIVTRPAQSVGLPWEAGLAERIVNDVLDADPTTRQAPAVLLPALELALSQLWVRRRHEDGRLTHAAYEKIGGVTGSMTAWCNQALGRLPPGHRATAQRVLTALVRPADTAHGTPATRRLVPLTQLRELAADPRPTDTSTTAVSAFDAVLAALTGHRIITTSTAPHPGPAPGPQVPGEATAELIHDALLRDWTDLRDWVAQDHQFQVWLQRTGEQQALHARSGLPDDLLKGSLLAEGNEWATQRALTPQITQLLHDSRQQQQKTLRRTRRLNTILATLLALALIATGIAFYQQQTATAAQRTAQSRQLAALSATLADNAPDLSSLLAVKAWKTSPTVEAATAIYTAPTAPLLRSQGVKGEVAAFSQDGARLATVSNDGTTSVWDAESGKRLATFKGPANDVPSVALSPDGTRLAVADRDNAATQAANGTTRVWDIASGRVLTTLKGPAHDVWSVAFSQDGAMLATGSGDGAARVWDMKSGQVLTTLRDSYPGGVGAVAFSQDGARLATSSYGGSARVWDMESRQILISVAGHFETTLSVALSQDGARLATAGDDGSARVWDVKSGRSLITLEDPFGTVKSVAFGQDGTRLATGSSDGAARVWDIESEQLLTTLKSHSEAVWSVAFIQNDTRLATTSDRTAQVWDVKPGRSFVTLKELSGDVSSVALSQDGARLATGSEDGSARVWDVRSGERLATVKDPGGAVWSVELSQDGARLATASDDGSVRLWDVGSGERLATVEDPGGDVSVVALSQDGARLATGSEDGSARVWDVGSGERLASVEDPGGDVSVVALSQDGARLATGSEDGSARVWDVGSGERLATVKDPGGAVWAVALSQDGAKLATGSDDGSARVWDARSGRLLITLRRQGPSSTVSSMAFGLDGARLATGSSVSTVHVWDVAFRDVKEIIRSICATLGREFTESERRQYLQGHDLTPVCGS